MFPKAPEKVTLQQNPNLRLACYEAEHGTERQINEGIRKVEDEILARVLSDAPSRITVTDLQKAGRTTTRQQERNKTKPSETAKTGGLVKQNVNRSAMGAETIQKVQALFLSDLSLQVSCMSDEFDDFLKITGLYGFLIEGLQEAWREDAYRFIADKDEFIQVYFLSPKQPNHRIQWAKGEMWKLTVQKQQLRDENARLKSLQHLKVLSRKSVISSNNFHQISAPSTSSVDNFDETGQKDKFVDGGGSEDYVGEEEEYGYDEYMFFYEDHGHDYELQYEEPLPKEGIESILVPDAYQGTTGMSKVTELPVETIPDNGSRSLAVDNKNIKADVSKTQISDHGSYASTKRQLSSKQARSMAGNKQPASPEPKQ